MLIQFLAQALAKPIPNLKIYRPLSIEEREQQARIRREEKIRELRSELARLNQDENRYGYMQLMPAPAPAPTQTQTQTHTQTHAQTPIDLIELFDAVDVSDN